MKTIQHNGATRKLTPILMIPELVSQTLKGLKTQTRRLNGLEMLNESPEIWNYCKTVKEADLAKMHIDIHFFKEKDGTNQRFVRLPYGQKGDVIWVRETFMRLIDCETGKFHSFFYKAEMPEAFHKQYPHKWKPNIHMPKAACRLFLEIVDIRPERLQDITEQDAIFEGVENAGEKYKHYRNGWGPFETAYYSFASLWIEINSESSWISNPWVWRIEFKVIPKPDNFI